MFYRGLRDAIRYEITAKNPTSIEEAMRLARVEKEKISNLRKRFRSAFQKPNNNVGGGGSATKPTGPAATQQSSTPIKRLSLQELREKRDKGLCLHCDEKYVAGHRCQHQKLFRLEASPEGGEEEPKWGFEEKEKGDPWPPIELTTNLMSGVMGVCSIWFIGKVMGKEVSFLVDSRATHNFIDPVTANRIGLPLQVMNTFEVEVVDGEKMEGTACCKDIKMSIQGFESSADLLVEPLGDTQVILRLKSLGPVLWDFNRKTLCFWKGGKAITLQGVTSKGIEVVEGNLFMKLLQPKRVAYVVQAIEEGNEESAEPYLEDLQGVMDEYEVFRKPRGLPPSRYCNHRIPLINPHLSVNSRPYRYLFYQKNEIERQIKEMDSGIIRAGSNPFASPMILICKADGSCRLCVDYRALNQNTVKDKFPILLIDDLLDKLQGAKIFSKLDLRSGYH